MKCQILFSTEILHGVSDPIFREKIISLSSAEFAHSMVNIKVYVEWILLPRLFRLVYFQQQDGEGWGMWFGKAKEFCSFCHRGVQLILAYSWARPAVFATGKGRGEMMLFLLFLHFLLFPSFFPIPLFHLLYCLFYLFFSLSLGDDTK